MFGQYEDAIRELVNKAHAPVLGLLGSLMPNEARAAVKRDVQATPGAHPFVQRLDQYPALFGVWLAEHVMHGMGASGHFDVYPHVKVALGGANELSPAERETLWWAFRRAMFKLGIQPLPRTSGPHFMTDEYLRQAGVPIAFADDLATKMLTHAKKVGVPDEDDQEGLLTWQAALLNRLQPPFSTTARKAVARDSNAYYTRTFLRVFSNQGLPGSGDALETAFAKAFTNEPGTGSIKRAALPQLVYRDGLLGLWFPPSNTSQLFELTCGQRATSIRIDEGGGFRQLPVALPTGAVLKAQNGEHLVNVKLWPDTASNRLLIFNEAGRLRASAQLGQPEPVELPPGKYIALCRFSPTNTDEWVSVSEEPQLIECELEVRPGGELTLANGAARVVIEGHNQPAFTLSGLSKVSLERIEFFYGHLGAEVEVPKDWLLAGQGGFEVRVSSGLTTTIVPVNLTEDGRGTAQLQEAIDRLGLSDGLHRVVFELGRASQTRALQRQSLIYWKGLNSVSHGLKFSLRSKPANLVPSGCAGVKVSDIQIIPDGESGRTLRLSFDLGQGRVALLSWNRPGLFIEVEVPGPDGALVKVSKPIGSTETVSLTQEKNIIVSGSEPGVLTLGDWSQFVDFAHRPSKSLPASFLASRLTPGARALTFHSVSGLVEVPLLQLSQPHLATAVDTSKLANVFEIRVKMLGEPLAIAIGGTELYSGRQARAEQDVLAGEWRTNDLARMQVYCAPAASGYVMHVLIDISTLPEGVWLLNFDAKIGSVWGHLEDKDEGRVGTALIVGALGQEMPSSSVIAEASELKLPEVVMRLAHLNNHFKLYWSQICWEQTSWLNTYWTALVGRIKGEETPYLTQLLDMVMHEPTELVRPGWLAKQSVAGQAPIIFAQRRDEYRRTNTKPHPISVGLRAMSELRAAVTPAFGTVISPIVACSFKNVQEIFKGLRPRGFQLSGYRQAIESAPLEAAYRLDDENFLPPAGELLGRLHLEHAWRDLERGYAVSQLLPSNRKSLALSMSRSLLQKLPRFDNKAPLGVQGQPLVIRPNKLDEFIDEAEAQKQENLNQIANACAWLAWACRLNVRKPTALVELTEQMETFRRAIPIQGHGVPDCFAYYIHVAPAMFAYYLLLWELVLTTELDKSAQHV